MIIFSQFSLGTIFVNNNFLNVNKISTNIKYLHKFYNIFDASLFQFLIEKLHAHKYPFLNHIVEQVVSSNNPHKCHCLVHYDRPTRNYTSGSKKQKLHKKVQLETAERDPKQAKMNHFFQALIESHRGRKWKKEQTLSEHHVIF